MQVPFLSLHDVTAMHGDEIREAARRVIDSGWYLQGKENELHMVDENYDNFVDFPSQRYFMSQGHWQSHEMYVVWMAITFVIGLLLYLGIRKKWYVCEN